MTEKRMTDKLMDWDTDTPLVFASIVEILYHKRDPVETIRYLFIPHNQTSEDVGSVEHHPLDLYLVYEPGCWSGPWLTENVRCFTHGASYGKPASRDRITFTYLQDCKVPRRVMIAGLQFALAQEALNLLKHEVEEPIQDSYDTFPEKDNGIPEIAWDSKIDDAFTMSPEEKEKPQQHDEDHPHSADHAPDDGSALDDAPTHKPFYSPPMKATLRAAQLPCDESEYEGGVEISPWAKPVADILRPQMRDPLDVFAKSDKDEKGDTV